MAVGTDDGTDDGCTCDVRSEVIGSSDLILVEAIPFYDVIYLLIIISIHVE